jgi:glycosyltransferase involved in cell wall biosynthesis
MYTDSPITTEGETSGDALRALRVVVACQRDHTGRRSKLIEELDRRVDLVGVVHPDISPRERGCNYARAFHPSLARWKAGAGFNRTIARTQTDSVRRSLRRQRDHDLVVQFQTLWAPPGGDACAPYAIFTDNTMALTQRLHPQWAPLSRRAADWWQDYEAEIFRGAAAVFTYSEFTRRSVVEDYGCSPADVLATGAGANQLMGAPRGGHAAVPRALFVGFEFERKGGSVLLAAWPEVRARLPAAELVIAGAPRRHVRKLPAGVSWTGPVDRERLSELYRDASVFVLPSLFEPWGHVFVEAMGHALPCIGTSCCAMPEIIEDEVTGKLVTPGDPQALADALVELLADPARTARMGRAAFAGVDRGRRWSDVADRLLGHRAARGIAGATPARRIPAAHREGPPARHAPTAGANA